MKPRSGQGLLQGGPIRPLPGLDFRVLVNDLPVAAVEVGFDAPSLRLNRTEGYSFLLSLVFSGNLSEHFIGAFVVVNFETARGLFKLVELALLRI
jgi:hypothetical protein